VGEDAGGTASEQERGVGAGGRGPGAGSLGDKGEDQPLFLPAPSFIVGVRALGLSRCGYLPTH